MMVPIPNQEVYVDPPVAGPSQRAWAQHPCAWNRVQSHRTVVPTASSWAPAWRHRQSGSWSRLQSQRSASQRLGRLEQGATAPRHQPLPPVCGPMHVHITWLALPELAPHSTAWHLAPCPGSGRHRNDRSLHLAPGQLASSSRQPMAAGFGSVLLFTAIGCTRLARNAWSV